jgi:hypothetical protein
MNEAAPTQPPVRSLKRVHRTFGGVVAIGPADQAKFCCC